jgi:hypothetical protein
MISGMGIEVVFTAQGNGVYLSCTVNGGVIGSIHAAPSAKA